MGKLTQMVEEMLSKHEHKAKKCQANILAEEAIKLCGKRKPTIMEKRMAELKEQSNTTGLAIYPKRNNNYQISFQALSKRFPNLKSDAGGIDVCKAIYVNDENKEVTVQFPNLHIEVLDYEDLITIV